MTKGGGSGKTPKRVVELLQKAVAEKGQSAVARETGLTQSAIHRYLAGIGEPSSSTLEKLGNYFHVPGFVLRYDSGSLTGLDVKKHLNAHMKNLKEERLEETRKKYGSFAQGIFDQIPPEDVDRVFELLDDIRDKALIKTAREDVRCQGILKE